MQAGKGRVVELVLRDGLHAARISCARGMVPRPGQYLLAGDGSHAPLPLSLFPADAVPDGFIAAPPIPELWGPGTVLDLRGPLGQGFSLPASARRVALVAFDAPPVRLRGLMHAALEQGAAVVLTCDAGGDDVPDAVEVQPLSSLSEIRSWADYIAVDVDRGNLAWLKERAELVRTNGGPKSAEVLIRTPVPCGGMAECGVCAVNVRSGWIMACKDGPVLDLFELI